MYEEDLNDSSLLSDTDNEGETNYKEENNRLRQENAILKAHFQEACSYSQRVKDLQEQNDALKAQLKSEKNTKDELQHRLQLTIDSSKESEEMFERQRKASNDQRNFEIQQANQRIKDLETKHQDEVSLYVDQINAMLSEKEQSEVQEKTLNFKLTKVCQSAERYFSQNIANIDVLAQILSQPKKAAVETPKKEEEPKVDQEEINKYKKHAREYKNKANNLKVELAAANRQIEDLQQEMNKRTNKLAKAIKETKEENKNNEQHHQERIIALEESNKCLKEELERTKAIHAEVIKSNTRLNSTQPAYIAPSTQEVQFEKPIMREIVPDTPKENKPSNMEQLLQNEIKYYKDQIEDLTARNQNLFNYLTEAKDQLSKCNSELAKKTTEYNTLSAAHEHTVEEVNAYRETLKYHQKPTEEEQKQIIERQQNEEKYKKTIQVAKRKIEELKLQLSEAQKENLRKEDEIATMNRQINELNDNNKQLESALSISRQEVAIMNHQKEMEKPLTADDLLPPSAFMVPSAEGELTEQIQPIANNSSLQPISKLHNIYSIIIDYYTDLLEQKKQEINDINEENENARNLINQFFVDCSIIVTGEAFTYEQFFDESAGQRFIEKLTELHQEYESLKHSDELNEKFANTFTQCFGETEDYIQKTNEVKELLDLTIAKSEKRKEQILRLKTAIKELNRKSEEGILNLQKENKSLNEEIEELNETIEKLTKKLIDTTDEKNKLEESLNEEKEQRIAKENELEENHTRQMGEADVIHNRENAEKLAEIQQANDVIKQNEDIIEDLNNQLDQANQQISLLQYDNQKLVAEINATKEDDEAELQKALNIAEEEKKHMQQTFDNSLAELREQCDKHRKDIIMLKQKLTEEECSNTTMKQQFEESQKVNSKLIKKIKSIKEQNEREKQLKDAECRMKISEAESSYQQKLDDERIKCSEDKQKIYSYFADQFNEFYSGEQEINDSSYRNTVQKVREVFCRISQSDIAIRHMVEATDGQPTEDAVAQLLLPSNQ